MKHPLKPVELKLQGRVPFNRAMFLTYMIGEITSAYKELCSDEELARLKGVNPASKQEVVAYFNDRLRRDRDESDWITQFMEMNPNMDQPGILDLIWILKMLVKVVLILIMGHSENRFIKFTAGLEVKKLARKYGAEVDLKMLKG